MPITKENAKEWIALLQAMAEGKAVQLHTRTRSRRLVRPDGPATRETWADTDFLWSVDNPEDYRIKPEPRRFWMNVYSDEGSAGYAYPTRAAADDAKSNDRVECIEVVEVLKDEYNHANAI